MSARSLATKIPAGGKVNWDQLEWAAFEGRAWALDGKVRSKWSLPRVWQIAGGVVVIFFALTPIMGTVILSNGGRFATAAPDSDPATTIPWSGVFFACAALALIALIGVWIIMKEPMAARGFGLYTSILAIMSLFGINRMGREQSVEDYQLWSIPVWIAAVLGGILGVLYIVAGVRKMWRTGEGTAPDAQGVPPAKRELLEERRERIAQWGDDERERVREDIGGAVETLATRGLITGEEAERARAAELGGLAIEMNFAGRVRS